MDEYLRPPPPPPADQVLLHLTAISLLLVLILMFISLWRKEQRNFDSVILRPWVFLLGTFFLLGIWGGLIFISGVENLDRADLLLAISGGFFVGLLHPVCAVSFFLANLLLRPWELVPESNFLNFLPKSLAGLSVASWAFSSFRQGLLHFRWNVLSTLFLAFVAWLFVANILAGNMEYGLPYMFERFLPIVVLSFLIFNTVRDEDDLRLLGGVLAVSIAGVVACAFRYTAVNAQFERLVGTGFLGNPNDLAALIVLAIPFLVFAWLVRGRSWLQRILGVGFFALMVMGIWASESRGAKLSLGIAALCYVLFCWRLTLRRFILLSAVLLALFVGAISTTRTQDDLEISRTARINYVFTGLRMVKYNPVAGVGMGQYPLQYERYTQRFDEWGERTAHSSWVLVLSETGLIGFGLFSLIFVSVVMRSWQLRRLRPEYFMAVMAYGVAFSFLSHTYWFAPYVLFSLVAAAHWVYLVDKGGGVLDNEGAFKEELR